MAITFFALSPLERCVSLCSPDITELLDMTEYDIQLKSASVERYRGSAQPGIQARVLARIEEMSDNLKGDVKRLTNFSPEYRLACWRLQNSV